MLMKIEYRQARKNDDISGGIDAEGYKVDFPLWIIGAHSHAVEGIRVV